MLLKEKVKYEIPKNILDKLTQDNYNEILFKFLFDKIKEIFNFNIKTIGKIQYKANYLDLKNLTFFEIKQEEETSLLNTTFFSDKNEILLEVLDIKLDSDTEELRIQSEDLNNWLYDFSYIEKKLDNTPVKLKKILIIQDNCNYLNDFCFLLDDNKIKYDIFSSKDLDKINFSNFDKILYFNHINTIENNLDLQEIKSYCENKYLKSLEILKKVNELDNFNHKLYFITNGAKKVTDYDININFLHSIIHGLNKVINYEYINLNSTTIDLSYKPNIEELISLFQEIKNNSNEKDIAFRNEIRYVARFRKSIFETEKYITKIPKQDNSFIKKISNLFKSENNIKNTYKPTFFKIDSKAIYLITGGLGALGLLFTRYLINKGAKKIVLTGRTGIKDANTQNIINELAKKADIKIIKADISKEKDIKELFNEISKLGELKGIIHSAGILDEGIIKEQNIEQFNKIMHPKAYSLINLHNKTIDYNLDFFINFSSFKSQLGLQGHPNYAIANMFLDLFSYFRRSKNLPCLSINWTTWSEIGLAEQYNETGILSKQGIYTINPTRGLDLFDIIIKNDIANIGAFFLDLKKFFKYYPMALNIPIFEYIIKTQKVELETFTTTNKRILRKKDLNFFTSETNINNLKINNTKKDETYTKNQNPKFKAEDLEKLLKIEIAKILKIPQSKLESDKNLVIYGFDSLMAIELANILEDKYKIILNPIILKDKNNLTDLSTYILNS